MYSSSTVLLSLNAFMHIVHLVPKWQKLRLSSLCHSHRRDALHASSGVRDALQSQYNDMLVDTNYAGSHFVACSLDVLVCD